MSYTFQDWFACPECDERDVVSSFAHRTDIVIECYGCGQISEFTIGEDIPLKNLDTDAIVELAKEHIRD